MTTKPMINTEEISNFVMIGSGNVAHRLGSALKNVGLLPLQVYSPTPAHAAALAHTLGCPPTHHTADIVPHAHLYIIATTDDALPQVIKKLPPLRGLVVHTSGSSDMKILDGLGAAQGVMYPMQTLKKNIITDLSNIPIFIEATDAEHLDKLQKIAQKITTNIHHATSAQRLTLHLAAVFACNFANHLWAITDELLQKNNLDPTILYGLMHQTLHNATATTPAKAQTGPAFRHDHTIINKHIDYLQNTPDLQQIYQILSESIMKKYGNNQRTGSIL